MDYNGINLASLPLRKLAATAVAQQFWERPDIKRRMFNDLRRRIEDFDGQDDDFLRNATTSFKLLGQDVINHLNQLIELLPVPEKLASEIKIIALILWQKACYWRHYVTEDLKLKQKYAIKIYWTSQGAIDKLKIVRDFWCKDAESPDYAEKIFYISRWETDKLQNVWDLWFKDMGKSSSTIRKSSLFCLGLMFRDDLKNKYLQKLKSRLLGKPPVIPKDKLTNSIIISKWVLYKDENCEGKENITNYLLAQLDEGSTTQGPCKEPVENLFIKCVSYQFEYGVRYFWDKLSSNEKINCGIKGAKKCIEMLQKLLQCKKNQWLLKGDSFCAIEIESILQILLFLIYELKGFPKLEFFSQHFVTIFQAICVIWPYQELCTDMLNLVWPQAGVNQEEFLKLIIIAYVSLGRMENKENNSSEWDIDISSDIKKSLYLRYFVQNVTGVKFFNRLLSITMDLMSKDTKVNVFVKDDFENVRALYAVKDHVSLSIIINDIDLVEHRKVMLGFAIDNLKEMIFNKNYKGVTDFFEMMELNDKESKLLASKLNCVNISLMYEDIESAYEHLNWISDIPDEIPVHALKNNTKLFFCNLMKNAQFENEDESSKDLKVLKEMRLKLLNLILLNKDTALADIYLNCITNVDAERIEWKNQTDAVEICFILTQKNEYDKADKYLSWRFETEEEGNKIRMALLDEDCIYTKIFDFWSSSYIQFNLCAEMLEWYFKSEKEIINFKESKYKAPDKLFNLVSTFWLRCDKNKFNGLDKFLQFCSYSIDDIYTLKMDIANDINSWIEHCVVKRNFSFKIVRDLFDWVYEEDDEDLKTPYYLYNYPEGLSGRTKAIRNYMESPKGTLLLVKIFQNEKNSSELVCYFLNTWITRSSNFTQMFILLEEFKDHEGRVNVSLIKSLLKMRKLGQIVKQENFIIAVA